MEIQPDISVEASETESESFLPAADVRQSQIAAIQGFWHSKVATAMEEASQINPFETDLPMNVVIPTVNAVGWSKGRRNCDIRPRLFDAASGKHRLVDSGSMITATSKLPTDKLDTEFKLVAVNGSHIKTYGVRKLEIKIGR